MADVARGIKLSKIKAKLSPAGGITEFLGKFQQLGLIRIVFDPAIDEEPYVQLTEKGKQEVIFPKQYATAPFIYPMPKWSER